MEQKKRSRSKNTWQRFVAWLKLEKTKKALFRLLILIVAALFLTWLLEYRQFLNDAGRTWRFVFERPKVFIYSSLIMFFMELLVYGLFQKVFITIATSSALILAFGYAHIAKFNFRGMPLLPDDFQFTGQGGTLLKFVDPWEIVRLVIAIILVLALGIVLDRATKKWLAKEKLPKSAAWWKRCRLVPRIVIIIVALFGFLSTTCFVRNHEVKREIAVDFLDTVFTDWDQVKNYEENGFLLGFLYNTSKLEMKAPADYNEENIAVIKNEVSQAAANDKDMRTKLQDAGYNVVTVLEESFYDPEDLKGYYGFEGEVMPNLHRLQNEVPHGTMYSIDYGGGTANIEFEVQTGLSNYFLKTTPYTALLPYQESVPSVASFMKNGGYDTMTIHSFNGGMYKRNLVLSKLGFDEFITELEFDYNEKDGSSEYINDRSAYNQLLSTLEKHDNPVYASLITMQNHAPYNENEYGESQFKVTNIDDENKKKAIETYLMTAHLSDQYLGEFYDKLQGFDEKTVVLLYGDHSPGVFPQIIENPDKDVSDLARHTPYLIFANFDLSEISEDKAGILTSPAVLSTTTPNCLPNTLFDTLGLEKPDYFYLLNTVCGSEPILTDANFVNGAPEMTEALKQYQLLTYDLTAGKQYYLKD